MKSKRQELYEILLPSFLTEEQKSAITARGGRLLVNASAGSGKTFVLSSRVVYSVTRDNCPNSLDKILVVTFTKAAAKEMKSRITALLKKVSLKVPNDPEITKQLLLLGQAKIATIDAFCIDFVKNHFDLTDVAPDFRIVDQHEMDLLLEEVLDNIFEKHYEENSEEFQDLSDYFDLKSDAALKKAILTLYEAMRKEPFPLDWLRKSLQAYTAPSAFLTEVQDYILDSLESIREYYRLGQEDSAKNIAVKEHLAEYYQTALAHLDDFITLAKKRDWDGCKEAAEEFSFGRKPTSRSLDEECKEIISCEEEMYLKPARENFKKLKSDYLFCTEDEFLLDIKEQLPYLQKLTQITEEFYLESIDKMRQENCMDFAEVEQLTLSLLVENTEDGLQKTELGREFSDELDEIFVDEFQDVNPLQDMLFSALSKDETNLFLVGDRKQSIYRFRQADPSLFAKKQSQSVPYSSGSYPAFITLAENFRSREEVINTVNSFFSKMMISPSGEAIYGENEKLKNGVAYPEAPNRDTEIHLITHREDQSDLEKEASYIAKTIFKMCNDGYLVRGEGGELRPCKPGDFAILLRSGKEKLYIFAQWLKEYGIDGWTESTSGYFSSREVSLMLNLLNVIDNPFQDVPLLSVLLSPVFAFSPDEIADIRASDRKAPLYLSLQKDSSEKSKSFLEQLDIFRQEAAVMGVEDLIQKIYDETLVLALFGAMESSEQKLANLRLLLHYAKSYEQNSSQGLGGFLRYIEQVQKNKNDFPAANLYGENNDAVKIMTIHKSKGLEFPIVFLAGCSKQFNKRELRKILRVNSNYGITAKHSIAKRLTRYPTIPYRAACLDEEREMLGEEMRILYVAMTRAKEKLFCILCEPNPLKHLLKCEANISESRPSRFAIERANSFAEWIFLAFFSHPKAEEVRTLAGITKSFPNNNDNAPIRFVYEEAEDEIQLQVTLPKKMAVSKNQIDELEKKLNYSYPFSHLSDVPVKLSVTQMLDNSRLPETSYSRLRKPILKQQGLSPAQKGTANHLFFQFADFKRAQKDLSEEISRLLQAEFITQKQMEALDLEGISSFLNSPLLSRLMSAKKSEREFSFFYEMPADKLYPQAKGESILLQGIADCVFWEEDGLVLLDYKTDRLGRDQIISRYAPQLQIYKTALEATLGEKVKECLIYSLHLRETLEV